jgi:hypothetical protein
MERHATFGETDELCTFTCAGPASVASPTFTPPVTVWSPAHCMVGAEEEGAGQRESAAAINSEM